MPNEQNVGNKNDLVLVGNKLPHGIWAEIMPAPRQAPDGQVRSPGLPASAFSSRARTASPRAQRSAAR